MNIPVMRRIHVILMCMVAFSSLAQQLTYPEDMLVVEYPYVTTVTFTGESPDICDLVTSLIINEDMLMDSGDFIDAWDHYLRHEQQEPGSEINVDKKNGFVEMTAEYCDDSDGTMHQHKSIYQMCYWNCADGKHKLFAVNLNTMYDGRYYEGQTTGLVLNLYENARHIMWDVNEDNLGLIVDPGTDEGYEYDAETKRYLVRDRETGEPLSLNEKEFYSWEEEKPVVTYWLPRQGKDIIAEIHYAARTDTIRLVWDGMRFNRE